MPKPLTIEEVREQALNKYNLTLLSTYYSNAMEKLEWLDNKTGIKFFRDWHSIKGGHTLPINPNKKLSIELIKKIALSKYNLTLVSDKYTNNHSKLEWLDNKTGIKFFRSWNDIDNGHIRPINVNNYLKDKNIIESYKGLGYIYKQTKEQYLSSKKKGNKRLFVITHSLLEEPWVTTMSGFLRGAETYLNKSGMSYGELTVYSLLVNNDINFESQYRVIIDGKLHKFDFYLSEYNLYIEYDGIQHYKSIESWGGEKALQERKSRDSDKNTYVSKIGASLLRIPYTVDTDDSILEVVSKSINKALLPLRVHDYLSLVQEVADYYDSHTNNEVCSKYNLSKNTITKYYKQVYGMSKKQRREVLQR